MARLVKITCPQHHTSKLLNDLQHTEGILEIQLVKDAGINPPGDAISVLVTSASLQTLMRLLDENQLGKPGGISINTSDPDSVILTSSDNKIDRDTNECTWEEMEMIISKDSNTTVNTLCLMVVSGMLAIIGITTSSLHIVIAGMLVAPGFMPVMRISLGLVTRNGVWYYGLIDTVKVYVALIAGATVTIFIMQGIGKNPASPVPEYYLLHQTFISYWSGITPSSILASIAASIAGVVLIATKRSVFTSGVMIGLALVPSAALIPLGLISGNYSIAGHAALRWLVDIILVFTIPAIYLFWEKKRIHKRNMQL